MNHETKLLRMEKIKDKLNKEPELELVSSDVSDDEGDELDDVPQERRKQVERDDFFAILSDDEEKVEKNPEKIFVTKPLKLLELPENDEDENQAEKPKKNLGARAKEVPTRKNRNQKPEVKEKEESFHVKKSKCGCLPNDQEGVEWFLDVNRDNLKKIAAADRFAVNQNPRSLYNHFQNLIGKFIGSYVSPFIVYIKSYCFSMYISI